MSGSVGSGELDPDRGMVAGPVGAADRAVDAGVGQAFGCKSVEQQVVDPQTGVARLGLPEIGPEGPGRIVREALAQGVGPALVEQALEGGAALGLEQGVGFP